jgi:hypothetical protein
MTRTSEVNVWMKFENNSVREWVMWCIFGASDYEKNLLLVKASLVYY